jgi:hypothetical protein
VKNWQVLGKESVFGGGKYFCLPVLAGLIPRLVDQNVNDHPNGPLFFHPKGTPLLTLQLSFLEISESMGIHDSEIVDANSID